ncbi:hypothetical protein V8G54_028058 [Vigna mungo]|uniref:Reverse transcriptase Ty1/copia-type domain-containing protein n=1 Tax=Vigna mungo TaxID=3915 RepID=A0AAQ3RK82_VIGMU
MQGLYLTFSLVSNNAPKFHKNCFPYTSQSLNNSGFNSLSLPIPQNYSHNYDDIQFPSNNNVSVPIVTDTSVASDIATRTNDSTSITNTVEPPPANTFNDDAFNINDHVDTIRRSTRPKRPPTCLTNFQTNNITRYPITNFLSYDRLSSDFRHTILSISYTTEPHTYKEVCKIPQWSKTIQEELNALANNNTWTITDLPLGKTAIGCPKGYTQLEGLDYLEAFSPVAKLTTLCLLLAVVASNH